MYARIGHACQLFGIRRRIVMIYEKIALWDREPEATLTSYVVDSTKELKLTPRRTVIVFPGGGYHFLSDREAEPIAFRFMAAGYNTFILRYTLGKTGASEWKPLIEAALAVKYVRENAEKYNTDPDHIFVCGFSAGGHLAASAGILWNLPEVRDAIGVTSGECPEGINRPTGMILSYPVITGGPKAHKGSIKNLAGHDELTDEDIEKFSLERHVDETASPAFIWHTFSDTCVPVENSIMLQAALAEKKVPFECHIYPAGPHGGALCNEFTFAANQSQLQPHNEGWIDLAINWIRDFA